MTTAIQELTAATDATRQLNQTVENWSGSIDQRMSSSEEQFNNWLNTRHVGFSLTDTLMDHSDSPITIEPRFGTLQEATDFQFNAVEDYAPDDNYLDINSRIPGQMVWFSEPEPTQFPRKVSVYANISVGELAHPSPKPVNRIAILHNRIGAHHRWITTGDPEPNYAQPRLFMGKDELGNLEIKGQSWSITNYDDMIAIAENENHNLTVGFSQVRIINLGPLPIHIKGFWIIHHGYQREL